MTKLKCMYAIMVIFVPSIVLIVVPNTSLQSIMSKISFQLSKTMYHTGSGPYLLHPKEGPDLTIRAVYFDNRAREGHKNVSVFLIEARKKIIDNDWISACEIDGSTSNDFEVHQLFINGWVGKIIDEKPFLTHTMALLDCYDMKARNGCVTRLHFKSSKNGFVVPVESERPYYMPVVHGGPEYKTASCIGIIYANPPYLKDWLNYQRTIGVDHVFMVADNSFTGVSDSYIKEARESGFLTLEVWTARLKSNIQVQYHSQMLAYHDCMYKSQGSYDYMLFCDQDDFFIPQMKNKSLKYYISHWCFKGTCEFDWNEFYPDCGMKVGPVRDGNLSKLLVSKTHLDTHIKKCLHKLSSILEVGIHDARRMFATHQIVKVPYSVAYVAHIRKYRRPRNKC